ncbi:MAG: amidohydrolase family protein [Candidatus Levybacteria bacterium]|nr:amidohydrolase family protein [Candidatus Levybacteria bacterium]
MSKLVLPGLIDPHVHLRDPGQTRKEDFYTGTAAAIADGFTTILDMPNNKTPITTAQRLNEKIKIAKEKIVCDVGFYFGSMGDNLGEFPKVINKILGLKLYLNQTTGNFLINKGKLETIFSAWTTALHSVKVQKKIPILLHAEDNMLSVVIKLVKNIGNKAHICHISTAEDLRQIIKAKKQGLKITCGVTPHHLFLTDQDAKRLGPFGLMKPSLKTKKDQNFLWKNLKYIDVVESDHAPHTIEEKGGQARGDTTGRAPDSAHLGEVQGALAGGKVGAGPRAANIPFGVPGLETTLPLLLTAVSEKRLTIDDIVRLCHKNPADIFGLKRFNDLNHQSRIEIDLSQEYIIENKNLFTKCKWTPFAGMKVKGKVEQVFIRGKKVFENGKILARPGSGKILC